MFCFASLALASTVEIASAHGELVSSIPDGGSVVRRIPESVSVALTEPPAPGTTVNVSDGCNQNVAAVARAGVEGLEIEIGRAEPGPWKVRFHVVSALDGHSTTGDFAFRVRGKAECPKGMGAGTDPDTQLTGGADPQAGSEFPEDGLDFPVIPFVIGSVMIVAIALLLRRAAG
jgi:methionine-rich copper-binding protein CopC